MTQMTDERIGKIKKAQAAISPSLEEIETLIDGIDELLSERRGLLEELEAIVGDGGLQRWADKIRTRSDTLATENVALKKEIKRRQSWQRRLEAELSEEQLRSIIDAEKVGG